MINFNGLLSFSGACSCRANQYACTLRQEIIPEKGALILFLLTRKQALRGNTLFILVARLCAIRGLRIETRVRSPARWPTAKGLDPGWARSRISAGSVFVDDASGANGGSHDIWEACCFWRQHKRLARRRKSDPANRLSPICPPDQDSLRHHDAPSKACAAAQGAPF